MKITTISKKTSLTTYLQSSLRDDEYFYEPESLMIYNLIRSLSTFSLSSFSPELFNSMLENVKDNEKVQSELKNGIYIYKNNLGSSKLNLAQVALFHLGFNFFRFFSWNEQNYEKIKTFFSKSNYKKSNLEEFKDILKKEFTTELINPNINQSDEAFKLLDFQIALKILVELEKHFDIHELLTKDISVTYQDKKILNSTPYTKEVSVSAFSYILQNCYTIPSYLNFYDQNISNTPDPLSLCLVPSSTDNTYFRSSFSNQIAAYDIMDNFSYQQILNKFITELKENFNYLSSNLLTEHYFNQDVFLQINKSSLDENIKKETLFDLFNVSPKIISLIEDGKTNFFLLNAISELDEQQATQTLDTYLAHAKDSNKSNLIASSLAKGDWNNFSKRKIFKSDKILTLSFTALPLLKKWCSMDNQAFDPDYKLLDILMHFKSEHVLKEYLEVIDKNRYSESLEIMEKTLSSSDILTSLSPYQKEKFSSSRIEKYIMQLEAPASKNKSSVLKF